MTAINFPDSPSDGDTHVVGGVTYTYNNAETKWKTTINSNAFLPLSGGTVSGNIVLDGELQHNGDTDTKLHFDTDTILFDTAGSERFRVGSAGQLGIGGATYGTDGQVLTSTGATTAPAWETLTTGTILQVLQDVKTDTDSTTNNIANAVAISDLSQAITMSDASNQVLVMANISVSGSGNSEVGLSLYRGTTQIYLGDSGTGPQASVPAGMLWSSGSWQGNAASIIFLDTPGTGTHTYTVRFGGNGSSTIYINRTGRDGTSDPLGASSITLMEVAV